MKKIKILLLVLVIALLFSGCRGLHISSIEDLIAPISLNEDDAAILSAVDDYYTKGYSIKIPSSGRFTTSFIMYDLNKDSVDEVIAFIEPNDNPSTVELTVLSQTDGSWSVINTYQGEGADINSIDFYDVNNDGVDEIIACWNMLVNSTISNLCVYTVGEDYSLQNIADSVKSCSYVVTDINEDDYNELLVFTIGSTSQSPKAELYSFSSGNCKLIGETKLDGTIVSYSNIVVGKTDEGTTVYADAIKSDGTSMVTEILYWSTYYDSVISPFYSYSSGRTSDTSRGNLITCRDIDNDSEIEIPLNASIPNAPEGVTAQNWVVYKNTILDHKHYSITCKEDDYILLLNDSIFSGVKLSYDSDRNELTFSNDELELFKILTVTSSEYNSANYSGYTEIFSNYGRVYLASVNDASNITIDDLKNSISSL